MMVTFYLYFVSVTDIEDEHLSQKDIPDPFFPLVQADITECSTYAAFAVSNLLQLTPSHLLVAHLVILIIQR